MWNSTRGGLHLFAASERGVILRFLPVLYEFSLSLQELWCRRVELKCEPRQGFDLELDNVFQDMSSDIGLFKSIELVLRLLPGGLLHGGVPCQSFGFMSCATHGRDGGNPWGNNYPFVLLGNVCATRFAFLSLLVAVRGGYWLLENPGRTTIDLLPPIRLLLNPYLLPRSVKWFWPQLLDSKGLVEPNQGRWA